MKLKLLLVDDEPGALRFLEHMAVSRCPGWEVVGTAQNGRQAIARIAENPPDMVLTDIRMPVIDGIELARQIRQHWPEIRTIVISGYEDFNAAQNAIRTGVSDYLLKPVNPDHLTELLHHAREQILVQKRTEAARLLIDALAGEPLNETALRRCFSGRQFQAALIRVSAFFFRVPNRVFARLQPVPSDAGYLPDNCWLITGHDKYELFLFQLAGPCCPAPLADTARTAARLLPGLPHTIVLQEEAFPLPDARQAARELMATMAHRLVLGATQVVPVEAGHQTPQTAAPFDNSLEQTILGMNTGTLQVKQLGELFHRLMNTWEEEARPLLYVHSDIARVVEVIVRGVAGYGSHYADHEPQLYDAFLHAATFPELRDRVWSLILSILRQVKHRDAPPGSEAFFENIEAYIRENISSPLSLKSLCAAMGISQTYMSRIFRKHTGRSFSEYLTQKRIEYAKSLMRERPDLLLGKVSEMAGYKDPLYFSKVFRSMEGIPPSHYLESIRDAK